MFVFSVNLLVSRRCYNRSKDYHLYPRMVLESSQSLSTAYKHPRSPEKSPSKNCTFHPVINKLFRQSKLHLCICKWCLPAIKADLTSSDSQCLPYTSNTFRISSPKWLMTKFFPGNGGYRRNHCREERACRSSCIFRGGLASRRPDRRRGRGRRRNNCRRCR